MNDTLGKDYKAKIKEKAGNNIVLRLYLAGGARAQRPVTDRSSYEYQTTRRHINLVKK
jgi:hypothetical protein